MRTFTHEHRIPFQDTDMAGVVHYTCILGYAEIAEHAALQDVGIEVISAEGGFPKVHVECDYLNPMRFGDIATIELSLTEHSLKSLRWKFKISARGKYFPEGKLCAEGAMVTVYVNKEESCELPASWVKLLT